MLTILTVKAAILLVLLLLIVFTLALPGRLSLHSTVVILDEVKHVSLFPCP
jgi:hypothetical protein